MDWVIAFYQRAITAKSAHLTRCKTCETIPGLYVFRAVTAYVILRRRGRNYHNDLLCASFISKLLAGLRGHSQNLGQSEQVFLSANYLKSIWTAIHLKTFRRPGRTCLKTTSLLLYAVGCAQLGQSSFDNGSKVSRFFSSDLFKA